MKCRNYKADTKIPPVNPCVLCGEEPFLPQSTRRFTEQPSSWHRHAEFRPSFFQPRVELLDHGFGPATVNLSRRVCACAQHGVAPFVDLVVHLGIVSDFLRQMRRNESASLGIAERYVAGHHRDLADADRNINYRE